MVEADNSQISNTRQCELLSVARSSFYYKVIEKNSDDDVTMRIVDEIYTSFPFYGRRRISQHLRKYYGLTINIKKVDRIILQVSKANQVWSTDITYVRLGSGFAYLCAVIDWRSRYV